MTAHAIADVILFILGTLIVAMAVLSLAQGDGGWIELIIGSFCILVALWQPKGWRSEGQP